MFHSPTVFRSTDRIRPRGSSTDRIRPRGKAHDEAHRVPSGYWKVVAMADDDGARVAARVGRAARTESKRFDITKH